MTKYQISEDEVNKNLCLVSITPMEGGGTDFKLYTKLNEENAKTVGRKVLKLFEFNFTPEIGLENIDPEVLEYYRANPVATMKILHNLAGGKTEPIEE